MHTAPCSTETKGRGRHALSPRRDAGTGSSLVPSLAWLMVVVVVAMVVAMVANQSPKSKHAMDWASRQGHFGSLSPALGRAGRNQQPARCGQPVCGPGTGSRCHALIRSLRPRMSFTWCGRQYLRRPPTRGGVRGAGTRRDTTSAAAAAPASAGDRPHGRPRPPQVFPAGRAAALRVCAHASGSPTAAAPLFFRSARLASGARVVGPHDPR